MTRPKGDFFLTATRAPQHPHYYENEVDALVRAKSAAHLANAALPLKESWENPLDLRTCAKPLHVERGVSSQRGTGLQSEPRRFFLSQALEHRHKKVQEKLRVPAPKNYYESLPVKPGFLFIDCLIKAPRAHIDSLEIHIPETFYSSDKSYFIKTLDNGRVFCTTEINPYKYIRQIEAYRAPEQDIMDRVACVYRMPHEEIQNMEKIVMDWNQFRAKIMGSDRLPWTLIQRFVKPPGHRPSVTRLYFYSLNNDNKADFAYFINSLELEQTRSNSLSSCVVEIEKPETLEVFKITGAALRPFQREARKIVEYLNRGYNVRIEEIVLDFLRDGHDTVWFCGCKGLKIDPATMKVALQPISNWWPDLEHSRQLSTVGKVKKGFNSYIRCKLCRLHYPHNELSNVISVRMYILFKRHVSNRKELHWNSSNAKVPSNDMLSQRVRVCSYCYMLIISEFELIKVEEALGSVLNIPLRDIFHDNSDEINAQVQFLPKALTQWRILLLAAQLFDFAEFPHTSNVFLHFNFAGIKTVLPVQWGPTTVMGEPVVPLQLIRLHYIFSAESVSILNFLSNFELEVRITLGPKYNKNVIARCRGTVLKTMPCWLDSGNAMYESIHLRLFAEDNVPLATLKLIVGISNDKNLTRESVKVLLNKQFDIYIAEKEYITCDPMPVAWMELFGHQPLPRDSFEHSINHDNYYTPAMTGNELKEMQKILGKAENHKNRPTLSGRMQFEEPTQKALSKAKALPRHFTKNPPAAIVQPQLQKLTLPGSRRSHASTRLDSFSPRSQKRRKMERELFIIRQYASEKVLVRPVTAKPRKPPRLESHDIFAEAQEFPQTTRNI